jgi:two-component system, NarL family, response regulator NreC
VTADDGAEPVTGQAEHQLASVIRLVLADDHAVVRTGLRLLLDAENDFEVVAEAGDVDAARRYVRGHHPDVLVLDLNMPGGSSLDAIPTIREEAPHRSPRLHARRSQPARPDTC